MNKNNLYEHPIHEPDDNKREQMMFYNPFQFPVIEGDSRTTSETDLGSVVILSSN